MSELQRCPWAKGDLYESYHDLEWGVPIMGDDQKLFEFLVLETFQAGLSWITVLKKRENFREAFDFFDFEKVAKYDDEKIEALKNNAGIIRNKAKINAAINNAQRYIKIIEKHGSFSDYSWGFVDGEPIINSWQTMNEVPPKTDLSDKFSKDLKSKGFKFVGSTVIYAHMQATGMVNDHLITCFCHPSNRNS